MLQPEYFIGFQQSLFLATYHQYISSDTIHVGFPPEAKLTEQRLGGALLALELKKECHGMPNASS